MPKSRELQKKLMLDLIIETVTWKSSRVYERGPTAMALT